MLSKVRLQFRDWIKAQDQWSVWIDSSYGPFDTVPLATKRIPHYTHEATKANIRRQYRVHPEDAAAEAKEGKGAYNLHIVDSPPAQPEGMPDATTTWTPDCGPQMPGATSAGTSPKGHTIFKYQLLIQEHFELELPSDSAILRTQELDGKFWIWVMHDLRTPKKKFKFHFFKTGADIPDAIADKLQSFHGYCKMHIQQELCLYLFSE